MKIVRFILLQKRKHVLSVNFKWIALIDQNIWDAKNGMLKSENAKFKTHDYDKKA